jgi:hypothetical protein
MIDDQSFQALEARVGFLERDSDGGKRVTRHILEQTRANSDDLATLIGRVGRVETKVDRLEAKFDGLKGQFDGLRGQFDGLKGQFDGFPKVIAEVMREVLAEKKA